MKASSRFWAGRASADTIRHMAEQEQHHLKTFDRLVNERRVRPTALEPVWRVAGFALGAATALMGEKAAFACTAAVEEVIDDHYARQIAELGERDPDLKQTVEEFRADEAAASPDGAGSWRRTGAGLPLAERSDQGGLPRGDQIVGTNLSL